MKKFDVCPAIVLISSQQKRKAQHWGSGAMFKVRDGRLALCLCKTISTCRLYVGRILVLLDDACRAGQEQTQGLDARSLFHLRDGRLEPGLQPLAVPVRSIVLPLGEGPVAERLAAALHAHILPIFVEAGVWLQDPKKYHSTLFHASPHQVGPDDLCLDLTAAHAPPISF